MKEVRSICYACYRPTTSCMCKYIQPLKTSTHFVILMHPKEFRKTKNGTGHFTHLSLSNSELYVGIDFTKHQKINELLKNPDNLCYVIYPSQESINLNSKNISQPHKNTILFLIDATWACSRAMLLKSPNINALPKVSFTHTKTSAFGFKKQPKEHCLSTMESTQCILELLTHHKIENLSHLELKEFLAPFEEMVKYQQSML